MRSCELSQPSRALYMTFLSAATMELRDAHPRARCINGHGNLHQRMFSVMNEWPGHALTQHSLVLGLTGLGTRGGQTHELERGRRRSRGVSLTYLTQQYSTYSI